MFEIVAVEPGIVLNYEKAVKLALNNLANNLKQIYRNLYKSEIVLNLYVNPEKPRTSLSRQICSFFKSALLVLSAQKGWKSLDES